MKRKDIPGFIIFIWFLILIAFIKCYQLKSQIEPQSLFPEPWERTKQILIITAYTTLDAISDAKIAQNYDTQWAHALDAAGTGLLITLPFTTKMNFKDAPRFLSSFVLIRIGIFDPIYNATRGFPVFGYRTDVSYWDKFVSKVNPPPSAEALGRGFSFSVGIMINLTGDYHGK